MSCNSLLNSFSWRRALKRFQPGPKAGKASIDITPILEAARLAPGSMGIQPFNIYVIDKLETKQKLLPVSYDQPQVAECSHLLIFCAHKNPRNSIERFNKSLEISQKYPDYYKSLNNTFLKMNDEEFFHFASNQTYIALGFSLAMAAHLKIGTCPMGGFKPAEVHKVLRMQDDEYPVAYLAIGHYDDSDKEFDSLANPVPKLRIQISDIVKTETK